MDVPEGEDHEGRWFLLGSRGETFETTAYASDRDIAVIYYVLSASTLNIQGECVLSLLMSSKLGSKTSL